MTNRQPAQPATAKQLVYLTTLTGPERLAALTKSEANFLIRFHSGPPRNASRAQQLYLYGRLDELEPAQIRSLVDRLAMRRTGETPQPLAAADAKAQP